MRTVIIANGVLTHPKQAREAIHPEDMLIAADGGLRHCRELGLLPKLLIGDFDSIDKSELPELESAGVRVIQHSREKDFTDLELALRYACQAGASEILVLAALGARWDQSLANLLIFTNSQYNHIPIRLLDGIQEITFVMDTVNNGELEIYGQPGDTVSFIPMSGDACGITTTGLKYSLSNEALSFGSTRGISNVLLSEKASVQISEGILMCVLIHHSLD